VKKDILPFTIGYLPVVDLTRKMCSVRGCSALALALGKPCGCLSHRRDEEPEATEDDAARMVEESVMEAAHAGWQPRQGITPPLIGAENVRKLKVLGLSEPDPDTSLGDRHRVLCCTSIAP